MGAKKKAGKGGGGGFKISAKVTSDPEIVIELQIKKKYLEEKFGK